MGTAHSRGRRTTALTICMFDEGEAGSSGSIVIAQPPVISRLANSLTATDARNLALSCRSAADNIDWLDLLWSIRYNCKKVHLVLEQLPEDIGNDISTRRLRDLVDDRYLELWSCPPLLKWFVKLAAQQGDEPFLSALLGRSPWPSPYNRPAAPAPAAAGLENVVPMLRLGMQLGSCMDPQEVLAARNEAALRSASENLRVMSKSLSLGRSDWFAMLQIPETSEPLDSQLFVLGYPIEVVHGPENISKSLGGARAAAARRAAPTAAASNSDEDVEDDDSMHADAGSEAIDQDEDDAASSSSTSSRSTSSRSWKFWSRAATNRLSSENTYAEDTAGVVDGRTSNGSNHPGHDSNTSSTSSRSHSSSSMSLSGANNDEDATYTAMDQQDLNSTQAKSSKGSASFYDWSSRSFTYKTALSGLSYLTGVAAAEAIKHGHYQLLKQMKEAGWLERMEPAHLAPALRAAATAAAAAATTSAAAASDDPVRSSSISSTTAAAVARLWFQSGAWLGAGAAALGAAAAACTAPQTAAATTTRRPAAAATAHANALAAAQLLLETFPQLLQISYDTYNQGNYIQKVQLLSLAADLYYSNSFRNIQLRRVAATAFQDPAMMLMDVCRGAQQDPKVVQLLLDLKVCSSMEEVYYVPSVDSPGRFDEGSFGYNGPILAAAVAERSSGPVVALMEAGAKLPVPR